MSNDYLRGLPRFRGRSLNEWADILVKHNVGTPEGLDERLSRNVRQGRVEVRDAKNKERLLGTLPRSVLERLRGPHDYIRVAVHKPLPIYQYDPYSIPESAVSIDTIDITHDWFGDNYSRFAVFITASPLDLLLRWGDFRLPEENETQWAIRWRNR